MIYGYCSWCLKKTRHGLEKESRIVRHVYLCTSCRNRTVQCRYCKNMARGSAKWDNECCAVHDGTIASFRRLSTKIADLHRWTHLVERDGVNVTRVAKVGGGVAVVGLVATGLGAAAAPAVGGAIGSLSGLSGAAASSHGLAVVGGGALAAGGGGMAAGTAAVAVGTGALGGCGGGLLVNKYVSDVQGFGVEKHRRGSQRKLVFVSGFLTADGSQLGCWQPGLKSHFGDHGWYEVTWESKRLRDLGKLALGGGGRQVLLESLKVAAKKAAKSAPRKVGPLTVFHGMLGVAGNPWLVALKKAQQTGHLLADLLVRVRKPAEYTFIGHSLGARVIYHMLEALASKGDTGRAVIRDIHLLGAAVSSSSALWKGTASIVQGHLHNYYSRNDDVLRYMYRVGTLFSNEPAGRNPIRRVRGVANHDVTAHVDGHGHFIPELTSYISQDS